MNSTEHGEITRGDVRMAYRLILGREPESVEILDRHRLHHRTLSSLRAGFLKSAEFRTSMGTPDASFLDVTARGYWAEPGPVEIEVTPEVEARLAARIRDQWTRLGEEDPHWSVLTDERFRARAMDAEAEADFRKTGQGSANLIDLFARRTGRTPPAGTCIELGCGVGRITRFLAERFERVIAVDISPGNLALCRKYMAEDGVGNVETVLISAIDDLAALPDCDMVYSMIVLQHNPPPTQHRMLKTLFGKIVPGGDCLFQTVADLDGYSFEAESYLGSPSPQMEIHTLPMAAILILLRESGMMLDCVRSDPWISGYGSYTFAAHREGTGATDDAMPLTA